MTTTTVKLPFHKETKNMLQFQAPDDDKKAAVIPTLYVAKSLFTGPDWPAFIEITVKGVDK